MFQSFCAELIPRASRNEYRNMQIVMFEKERLLFVCEAHTVQWSFVKKQQLIIAVIIHIITLLNVVH
jgi:hypothetical protein